MFQCIQMRLKSPFPARAVAAHADALAELSPPEVASILECGPDAARLADILDSLPANIALLDAAGVIVEVNESWRSWGREHGSNDPAHGLGANYLTVCDRAIGGESMPAARAAAGIRAVLRGESRLFSMEYVMELAAADVWFLLTATPVGGTKPTGVTLMHFDISARKRDEGTLWRFAAAMDALSDGIFLIDRTTMELTYVNDAACRLHGSSREVLLALKPWEIMSTTRAELESKYDRIAARGGNDEPEEVLWQRSDGTRLWIEIRRHAHCVDGAVSMVVLVRDVTARKVAESRILYLNRVYAILSGINTLIVRVRDREELFREACRLPVDHGGFPACWVGILDRPTNRLLPVATAGMSADYREAMTQVLASTPLDALARTYTHSALAEKRIQVCNDSENDSRALVREHHAEHGIRSFAILPLIVADEAVGVLGLYAAEPDFFHDEEIRLLTELAVDVSFAIDHIDKQEKLDYLGSYDALTGLPNRELFLDRLAQFVRMTQGTDQKLAVYITDLERFRNINDSLGRASGDEILRQVGNWLTAEVGDALVLGRLDADHFAVIVPACRDEGEVARLVERLLNAFTAHSFRLGGISYRLALRAGVAIFPNDGEDADTLFKNAGAALTKAKVGGDRFLFYAEKMTVTVAGRLGLENQLRQALEREEFVLHYQPKVKLASGEVVGAEALIRWNDPRTGLVPPGRFIPILEETGLIFEVGRWVMNKAVEDYLRWRREGFQAGRIAVNVSPLQLRHGGFVAEIERIAGIDPCVSAGLELEITESLIMENVKLSIAALHVVRERGITIAIDDFGTGYSSLSYLAKLPIDTLKIDRSFILDLAGGAAGVSLVSTIINLAHSLELNVVAEGVETAEQMRVLAQLTCDEVQGYWFSKPLPAAAFEEKFLRRAR
jgi:diguanylate cyclase (GGDEF)-like protein/PAS domain S-box-containing protein